ncbi:hypothetical protein [Nocardioides piscis]|uniref:SurA N-terminal domain-containing protein n=1 Tax=Nocardioides piscis TaxID=2714938 RepID=A0A6G7YC08_9ACTN|nr:hypothetical protein [Nocardioides piscis]QIK74259.1 hypothetical protein G7071_01195 [Nocardioides piscis]
MHKFRLLVPVVLAGVLTTTGCAGSASPGVAARVGDETITAGEVDETTRHLCTALGERFKEEGRLVQLGVIRQGVLQFLVLRSQADQLAEEYGVEPSAAYRQAVAEHARTATDFPEEVRDDYVTVLSTDALASDIASQVGRIELAEEGFTEPTEEQVQQAARDAFTSWPDANGIDVDPKYGIELVDGVLTEVDTSLSFAVSDKARAGLPVDPDPADPGAVPEPDPAYVGSLPSNQTCG